MSNDNNEKMYQPDQTTYYELDLPTIRSLFIHELGLSEEQVDLLMSKVDEDLYVCTLESEGYREVAQETVLRVLDGSENVLYAYWQDYLQELAMRKVLPIGDYLLWIS